LIIDIQKEFNILDSVKNPWMFKKRAVSVPVAGTLKFFPFMLEKRPIQNNYHILFTPVSRHYPT